MMPFLPASHSFLNVFGECARYQGRPEDARSHFTQALELHRQLYPAASLRAYHEEAQLQALLSCEIGVTWYDVGNFVRARFFYSYAEQVLRDSEVVGGPVWAQLCLHRSYVFWNEGAYEEAQRSALEALSLFEQALAQLQSSPSASRPPLTRIRRTLRGDIADCGRAYSLLGLIISTSGGAVAAVEHLRAALAIYEQQQCIREIGIASATLSDVHLRQAEYSQAQEALSRSRHSGETTGDDALLAVVSCNQGILSHRLGHLLEAEHLLKQAISLAEKIHDPGYLCLFCSYLARILQDQGRLEEATEQVHRTLTVSHALNSLPSVSAAFISVARLRLSQVQAHSAYLPHDLASLPNSSETLRRLLRTRRTLERVLELNGVEIETRIEGYVLLAQILLLLAQNREAEQVAHYALAEAQRYEQTWLCLHARRLLAVIAASQGLFEQATSSFEQTSAAFQEYDMLLEYARTLGWYAFSLLRYYPANAYYASLAFAHLQTARQIFLSCQAHLDLPGIDHLLNEYSASSSQELVL